MKHENIQVFPDLEYVLNPRVNFTGDFYFVDKIFRACQKGHAYDDYIKREYLDPLDRLFGKILNSNGFLILMHNYPTQNGRVTCLSPNHYLGQQSENLLGERIPNDIDDIQESITWCKEKARTILRQIKSYLSGGTANYPDFLNYVYTYYKTAYDKMYKGQRFYPQFTVKKFLENYCNVLIDYLTALRKVEPIFKKPLDIAAISKTVDVDKCSLAIAKAAFDTAELLEEEKHQLLNSFIVANNFKEAMEAVKKEYPKYRLSTTVFDFLGEPTYHYTADQFVQEVNKVLAMHPEYKVYHLNLGDGSDYRSLDTVKALEKEIIDKETIKELSGSWEFLPKGERVQDTPINGEERGGRKEPTDFVPTGLAALDDAQLLQDITSRYAYLESKDYLFNIKGKNNFEGYIGYIYPNGIVLFEKLYESIDPLIPARSNATYIMSVDNFVQMSRKSKPEIIDYIKSGGNDVRRIYHSKNPGRWEEKLGPVIEGNGYSDETLDIIDSLLKSGELKQDNEELDEGAGGLDEGTGGRK